MAHQNSTVEANSRAASRLLPVKEWPRHHPWPSELGLRNLIFHGPENGFDKVIRRVGRRVLIDEGAFAEWVAQKTREASRRVRSRGAR